MNFETLIWNVENQIGQLTFNRPQALNALNQKMMDEVGQWVEMLSTLRDLRAVLLQGSGEKAFIAGADIKELSTLGVADARIFSQKGHQVLSGIQALPIPVVAMVNGFALGGGCEMAMACDFILASDSAVFGLPEVTLGLIPGFGGTQTLPKFVGAARAAELIYTGRKVTAQEALQYGLVNSIHPFSELKTAAVKLVSEITKRGPKAVAAAKNLLTSTGHLPLEQGLKQEADAFAALFSTSDQKEGTRAFIEKRPPQFRGQ